jgi:hypothetical protein
MEGLRYYEGRLSDQQTALLQYQRENLHFLSEEILCLQEKLSKYEQSDDGSTPQVRILVSFIIYQIAEFLIGSFKCIIMLDRLISHIF